MMARTCDACAKLIAQPDDAYLELQVRVMDATADSESQDASDARYGDFCNTCISTGAALSWLLAEVKWTLSDPARLTDSESGKANGSATNSSS